MKCDYLEAEQWLDYSGEPRRCYPAEKADEIIAELKADNKMLNEQILLLSQEHEKLKAENESLKAKLESVQASAYAESVDAGMRERRLRRALWLARALRARDIQRWWIAATCAPITERACSVWNIVERKCLKKAEEYK